MLTRFDHAVLAVRDVGRAIASFRRLGFDARPGGAHPGMGTKNAVIRFGLDYVELLSVVDPAVGATSPVIKVLVDKLHRSEGFVGYGITTDDLEADAARIRASGLDVVVMPLARVHPDGSKVSWLLGFPGGMPWLSPWPFLIQADQTDEERLRLDPPGEHPNGAQRCVGAVVATGDLPAARELLTERIGLAESDGEFRVGEYAISADPDAMGEGLIELRIKVADLEAVRVALPAEVVSHESAGEVRIDPAASAGAQLVLVAG